MLQHLKQRLHKYRKWEPLAFFVGGFIFDALLLHRIDDPLMLIHQAVYLVLSGFLIAWDMFCEEGKGEIPRWISKVWSYREGILHFLLGTLLNVYTIFYFKSGSLMSSLSFLLLLALLLFLNEARPSRIPKHMLRNALFCLCLISYLNIIVSIAVGSIGAWVFGLALIAAYGVHAMYVRYLSKRLELPKIRREIQIPFLAIGLVYSLLYVLKVLPPVPLSVKHMGIYREISKEGDSYKLGYARPDWKFWESGDQTFSARPGDKIYCFVQVFSPTRFKGNLFVRWQHHNPESGWQSWDAIPLNVVGGREDGFRGYTVKTNYTPGDWRVSIETADGREVGRLGLNIIAADISDPAPTLSYELR
jgi:hypothetical protein